MLLKKKIPIWIMRQAGRYMPEYIITRRTVSNFLDLCFDVQKVIDVTMQPIDRFDFDAAIIFSDILVLPYALGWDVKFEDGLGPVLKQFKNDSDLKYLNKTPSLLKNVYDAIYGVRKRLDNTKSLIGFAGAPWTVMSYMLEGDRSKGKNSFNNAKEFIYKNKNLAQTLLNLITEHTIKHLINQIDAGVGIIQIFDSWCGILPAEEYESFVINPTKQIVQSIKEKYPQVLIIGFPLGSGLKYERYIDKTGIDVIGVDQFVPVEVMKKWKQKVIVQGNLDPVLLLTDPDTISKKVDIILSNLAGDNFIFNLGHGILPQTPVENVDFLVNYVRNYS